MDLLSRKAFCSRVRISEKEWRGEIQSRRDKDVVRDGKGSECDVKRGYEVENCRV
jgi:hypothetical protein